MNILVLSVAHFFVDVALASIAGLGFSYASNPPKHVLWHCALLGGIGYATRLMLLHSTLLGLAGATLVASIVIGLLTIPFAKQLKVPIEIIAFPSLLPMIPGLYAYKAILAVFLFMQSTRESDQMHHLVQFFNNAFITASVSSALAIGISIVLLLFYKKSFMMARHADLHYADLKEKYRDELRD